MELLDYLKIMVQKEASDLYLTTGNAPCIKISGHLFNINNEVLIPGKVKEILYTHINEGQRVNFEQNLELNFGLSAPGVGRFRVNAMMQRSEVAMVLRHNRNKIPTIEDLCLPPILKKIIMEKRGLVLVVGATSSGKSTTLASMIEYRSAHTDGHIICIEDPIEFMHDHHKSIVTQREIGLDTLSYEAALKNALRQAPDVILIGEIRTCETMGYAITFSETGHLCLSTLHASNALQALDRIIHFFPHERQAQLLLDLSLNLVAIISQRLVPTQHDKLIVAVEILLGTPLVHDLIRRGDIDAIRDAMERGENAGMKTIDSALYDLYRAGKISVDEALAHADSANNLRLRINLKESIKPNSTLSVEDLLLKEQKGQDGVIYPENNKK